MTNRRNLRRHNRAVLSECQILFPFGRSPLSAEHYEIKDAFERNPEDGRFLTEDTYRGETNEPDTWHLYAYCKNNPVNYVDPSGHWVQAIPYLIKLIVGGCVVYVSYKSWKRHTPKTRYNGKRVSFKQTIYLYVVVKVAKHALKKYSEHTTNKTKANREKHQNANSRRAREQGKDKKRKKKGWKSRK